jgi:Holliday junction resolvase
LGLRHTRYFPTYPHQEEQTMAQTPEKKVKDKVVGILKDEGVYYFFPATYGYGRSGVPDIIACANGYFVGIECKAGKNKPTALQVRELEAIRAARGVALVVNEQNWDSVRELVRNLRGLS